MAKNADHNVIAPLRARLINLYNIGKEIQLSDDEGEFTVWVQRITDAQENEAVKKSKIVRAPIVALKRDKTNPERLEYLETLEDWHLADIDSMINILINPKVQEALESNMSRIAEEDEWAKDDYLITLQEAYNSGMKELHLLEPDDKEAARIHDELMRYTKQVEDATEHDRKEYTLEMLEKDPAVIQDQVIDIVINSTANAVQQEEFYRWQVYFSVRDPQDHNKLVFASREDIDLLSQENYQKLRDAYDDIKIEGLEGKG